MTWLVITAEDGSERIVELGNRILRIGRAPDNDIQLSDERKSVSRSHAELRLEDGHWVIVDLDSQNGTWIDGERRQRAELMPEVEAVVGTFRIRRREGARLPQTGATVSTSSAGTPWVDVVIPKPPQAPARGSGATPAAPAGRRPGAVLAILVVAAVVAGGSLAWSILSPGEGERAADLTAPAPLPASTGDVGRVAPPEPDSPADQQGPSPAPPPSAAPDVPVRLTPRAALPSVPRRPDESEEGWQNRIAAIEARYEYSKAALDRRDFGSAASGFEAILRAAPGFGDVPDLLVQARAGLRASATELYEAGNRLETAGDWFAALQQYDRARQLDPTTPGLAAAERRVRGKLQVAGRQAFDRGRESERLGNTDAALQEYLRAVQWLPFDDPNYAAAQVRVEQLRASKKD